MGKHRSRIYGKEVEAIIKMLTSSHTHNPAEMFGDFVEMGAIAISNKFDLHNYDRREARYMEIVGGYPRDEVQVFSRCLGELALYHSDGPRGDALGEIWAGLELKGDWFGQYFTPYNVSHMMAKMSLTGLAQLIRENGFVTIQEPACGPGGMMIAAAHAAQDEGFDYTKTIHVTGIDIDRRCVHMAYLQSSLLGIPAVIWRGNSLSMEMHDAWCTPAHIAGGWARKLHDLQRREGVVGTWQELAVPDRVELLQRLDLPEEQSLYQAVPHTLDPGVLELLAGG